MVSSPDKKDTFPFGKKKKKKLFEDISLPVKRCFSVCYKSFWREDMEQEQIQCRILREMRSDRSGNYCHLPSWKDTPSIFSFLNMVFGLKLRQVFLDTSSQFFGTLIFSVSVLCNYNRLENGLKSQIYKISSYTKERAVFGTSPGSGSVFS